MAEKKKKSALGLIAAAAFGGAKVVGGATRDAIDAVATNVEQNPNKMSLDFGGGAPVKKRKKPTKKKAAPKKKATTGTRRKVKSKDKKVAELEAEIKRLRGAKIPTTKKKSVRRVVKKEKPKKVEPKERTEFVTATGVYTKKNGKVTFKPYK
ncbi:MAG: hypothetical protein KAJ03_07270 [Gammaproteobacteria bacterium]|nr:hypothetical protein [Gammaproteobacteria bacterium]